MKIAVNVRPSKSARRLKRWSQGRALATFALGVSMAACGGEGSDDPAAGACDVRILEPVLAIRSASNGQTGAQLSTIRLTSLKFKDVPVDLAAMALTAQNIVVEDNALVCTPPCALGADDGKFSFGVVATGYQEMQYIVEAAFATKEGRCPRLMSNGTKLDVTLSPL